MKKAIAICLISLMAFMYSLHYINNATSFTFELLLAFATIILVVLPTFAYGVLLFVKELNIKVEHSNRKSIFYHLYSLIKVLIGALGIGLGALIVYLDISGGLPSWPIVAIHVLFIYSLISVGFKLLYDTMRAYRSRFK
jgi:hypothetical protein